ncbi:hypothetical protein ACJQWY_02405 [Weissella kandleri]|uniref:hypothetical protein n=1 Tax=Weissella kandleri TaxID=1616 RepID=UPI00387E5535
MSDIWSWREELAKAHLNQSDIGRHFFENSPVPQISTLVKKMVVGEGKTATERDKEIWAEILEFIEFKKNQVSQNV